MRTRSHRPESAFTLIELMIVLTIIAIIATIAIPNLLASRLTANESSAISTLRTISSAQAQAQSGNWVDSDGDGAGEFLYLAELSGVINLRGLAVPMDPAAVSVSLGLVNDSAVNKSGYHFAMFLPDVNGVGVAEDPNGGKAAVLDVDADLAERFWACYAWPSSAGSSGRRVFVINQAGTILQTTNVIQGYTGAGGGSVTPTYDAAFSAGGDMTLPLAQPGVAATDGGIWIPVN